MKRSHSNISEEQGKDKKMPAAMPRSGPPRKTAATSNKSQAPLKNRPEAAASAQKPFASLPLSSKTAARRGGRKATISKANKWAKAGFTTTNPVDCHEDNESPDEETPEERRLRKNRINDRRKRERRRLKREYLQEQKQELTSKNEELKKEREELQRQIAAVKHFIQSNTSVSSLSSLPSTPSAASSTAALSSGISGGVTDFAQALATAAPSTGRVPPQVQLGQQASGISNSSTPPPLQGLAPNATAVRDNHHAFLQELQLISSVNTQLGTQGQLPENLLANLSSLATQNPQVPRGTILSLLFQNEDNRIRGIGQPQLPQPMASLSSSHQDALDQRLLAFHPQQQPGVQQHARTSTSDNNDDVRRALLQRLGLGTESTQATASASTSVFLNRPEAHMGTGPTEWQLLEENMLSSLTRENAVAMSAMSGTTVSGNLPRGVGGDLTLPWQIQAATTSASNNGPGQNLPSLQSSQFSPHGNINPRSFAPSSSGPTQSLQILQQEQLRRNQQQRALVLETGSIRSSPLQRQQQSVAQMMLERVFASRAAQEGLLLSNIQLGQRHSVEETKQQQPFERDQDRQQPRRRR